MTRSDTPTVRQMDVLQLLLSGCDVGEIAERLILNRSVVRRHLQRLCAFYGTRHSHHLTCLLWERRRDEEKKVAGEIERQRAVLARDLAREKARARVV